MEKIQKSRNAAKVFIKERMFYTPPLLLQKPYLHGQVKNLMQTALMMTRYQQQYQQFIACWQKHPF